MSYSQDQLALKAHIEASNQKIRDENNDCFLILPVVDIDHWAEYGITTVEQYEHSMAVGTYMDVFKETYGVKPRWANFEGVPVAKVWEAVNEMVENENAAHREREAEKAKRKTELAHNNRYRPNNVFADMLAS